MSFTTKVHLVPPPGLTKAERSSCPAAARCPVSFRSVATAESVPGFEPSSLDAVRLCLVRGKPATFTFSVAKRMQITFGVFLGTSHHPGVVEISRTEEPILSLIS